MEKLVSPVIGVVNPIVTISDKCYIHKGVDTRGA